MAIVVVLLALLVGSILFYFLSPWHLTPLASNWGSIDGTIQVTWIVTGLVFAAVNLFLVYAIVRYRYRRDRRASYQPEDKKLEYWLTGLTAVGISALLAPGLFVWGRFVDVPPEAHIVEVVGQQWNWRFRYPGEDEAFGRVSTELVSADNPFGMDPDDPLGQDDVLVNAPRVVLPVDQPVRVMLRSQDVIHNFQVAQFRAKMDMVPGQVSYFWFTPTRKGDFEILCAELCGIAHFAMRGKVEVVEPERFEEWLAEQPNYREVQARDGGDPAAGEARYAPCAGCHGPKGQGMRETGAPKLAGQSPWYLIRQLQHFKSGLRGTHEADTRGQQMRPFARTLPDYEAMADVVAYIGTFPDKAPARTLSGDSDRGERLYDTCAACHGAQGQGDHQSNAPRLAGLSDWYLKRQLEKFQAGIRGGHPDDMYGWQMVEMAKVLVDESGVRDVVSHITTLPRKQTTVADASDAGRSE